MANLGAIRGFGRIFEAYPFFAFLVYGAVTLASCWGAYYNWSATSEYSGSPTPLTIAVAAPLSRSAPVWTKLSDMKWDCEQSIAPTKDDAAVIVLTEPTEKYLVIYDPENRKAGCKNLVAAGVVGVLEPINDRRFGYLRSQNFAILDQFDKGQIYTLCGSCNLEGARSGALIFSALGVFFLAATLLYWGKASRKAAVQRNQSNKHSL